MADDVGSVLLTDSYPQADGAPWDSTKWIDGYTGAGAAATVQGGVGQLLTGTAGGYSGAGAITRVLNVGQLGDIDWVVDFRKDGDVYPRFILRSSRQDEPAPGSGFEVDFVQKWARYLESYAATDVATWATDVVDGVWNRARFRLFGPEFKIKLWTPGGAEPTSWNLANTTQTLKTSAGWAGVRAGAGGAPSTTLSVDNVAVRQPVASSSTTPVQTDTSSTWSTRAAVAVTRSPSWAVRAAAAINRASTWTVRAAAAGSRASSWSVRAAVAAARSDAWTVRALAAITRTPSWAVRTTATITRAPSWTVRTTAAITRAPSWTVRAAATIARSATWSVLDLAPPAYLPGQATIAPHLGTVALADDGRGTVVLADDGRGLAVLAGNGLATATVHTT